MGMDKVLIRVERCAFKYNPNRKITQERHIMSIKEYENCVWEHSGEERENRKEEAKDGG